MGELPQRFLGIPSDILTLRRGEAAGGELLYQNLIYEAGKLISKMLETMRELECGLIMPTVGVNVAALLLTVGLVSPYWYTGIIDIDEMINFFGFAMPFIETTEKFRLYGGIWFYSFQRPSSRTHFSKSVLELVSDIDKSFLAIFQMIVALPDVACLYMAVFQTYNGGVAFIAGVAGCAVAYILAVFTPKYGHGMHLHWAFYTYATGALLLILVSFCNWLF